MFPYPQAQKENKRTVDFANQVKRGEGDFEYLTQKFRQAAQKTDPRESGWAALSIDQKVELLREVVMGLEIAAIELAEQVGRLRNVFLFHTHAGDGGAYSPSGEAIYPMKSLAPESRLK